MAKGPQGQKRRADVIGCAVLVGHIALGEVTEILTNPAARSGPGKAGSKARADSKGNVRPLLKGSGAARG
jgi:glycerol uptake facilitator-like aquaporin